MDERNSVGEINCTCERDRTNEGKCTEGQDSANKKDSVDEINCMDEREHIKFMEKAIVQAEHAYANGDVPIGCVIVYQDKVIARGYNKRNKNKTTLAHAELLAINQASKKLGDWRLEECTMYVTLEPCQMCAGAIVQARIPKVVIGCMNPKAGCAGSVINLFEMKQFNHQVETVYGVCQEKCSQMMKDFFKDLRNGRFA
jgi:tRNA(adenine34) deaminase